MTRENEQVPWLVLAYRVPAEAVRLRMSVWRQLKASGAVYLTNSVATLPAAAALVTCGEVFDSAAGANE